MQTFMCLYAFTDLIVAAHKTERKRIIIPLNLLDAIPLPARHGKRSAAKTLPGW